MLIKEVFVVLCYYLYIQSLSKIAASVNLNLSNHVRFLWENMTIAVYKK